MPPGNYGPVSPDGRFVPVAQPTAPGPIENNLQTRIGVIDLVANQERRLSETLAPFANPVAEWMPDSRTMIVRTERLAENGQQEFGLWLVPVNGDEPRRLDLGFPTGGRRVRVSPDGRRLLIDRGQPDTSARELRRISNLVADLESRP